MKPFTLSEKQFIQLSAIRDAYYRDCGMENRKQGEDYIELSDMLDIILSYHDSNPDARIYLEHYTLNPDDRIYSVRKRND